MTYSSELDTGAQRFLSRCIQQAFDQKWVTPESFLETFGPLALMTALEAAPELRSEILVEAAGVHSKIAPKKSTTAAAEDVRIALDEQVCSPAQLLDLFNAEDRVRYLDAVALWGYLTRDEFWKGSDGRTRERMVFVLQTALEEELLDLPKLLSGVTTKRLAECLPKALLERVLVDALEQGCVGKAFGEAQLVESLPLEDWVAHVPLKVLWTDVIETHVLTATGWTIPGASDASPATSSNASPATSAPAAPEAPAAAPGASATGEVPKKRGKKKTGDASTDGATDGQAIDVSFDDIVDENSIEATDGSPESASRDKHEQKAREKACTSLEKIERLPTRHEELPTPVLLAIDSMYSELLTLSSDEAREECIRDAFPNEVLLSTALVALAELLDPKLDAATLGSGDVDSLIKLVLFEERRRTDRARRSVSPSSPPPVAPSGKTPSVPPPPPVSSGRSMPPPLPPSGARATATPPPLPQAAGAPPRR